MITGTQYVLIVCSLVTLVTVLSYYLIKAVKKIMKENDKIIKRNKLVESHNRYLEVKVKQLLDERDIEWR